MMAEVLLKNPICSKCGENARPQALFCFACGGKIIEQGQAPEVSSVWFRSDLAEDSPESGESSDPEDAGESDIEPDEAADIEGTGEIKASIETSKVKVKAKESLNLPKAEPKRGGKLTSAADLRKRPKPLRSERVEVIWNDKTDSPNFLFVVCGFALVLFALLLFFASLYLR